MNAEGQKGVGGWMSRFSEWWYYSVLKDWLRRCVLAFRKGAFRLAFSGSWLKIVSPTESENALYYSDRAVWCVGRPLFPENPAPNYASRIHAYDYGRPSVIVIENVRLLGGFGVGFDESGAVIRETTIPFFKGAVHRAIPFRTFLLSKFSRPGRSIDFAYSLNHVWSQNFCHWVLEVLPRLEGVLKWQQESGERPVLLLPANGDPIQRESLQLLGFHEYQFQEYDSRGVVVKRLLVSSFRHQSGVVSPQGVLWLRREVFRALGIGNEMGEGRERLRLLIARRPSHGRSLINQEEVSSALASYGFQTILLEKLNFAEKVRLLSRAEIVVAPHGAALASIAFCNSGGVIALMGRTTNEATFFALAKSLGLEYGYLASPASPASFDAKRGNILVDVKALVQAVELMIKRVENPTVPEIRV